MRTWTIVAALLLAAPMAAQAQEWCGFHTGSNTTIKCGYSSYAQCHDAVGKKDAYCIPDPDFASRTRSIHPATQVAVAGSQD